MISHEIYKRELHQAARKRIENAKLLESNNDLSSAASEMYKVAGLFRDIADHEVVLNDIARRNKNAKKAENMAQSLNNGQRVFGEEKEEPQTQSIPATNEYRASVDELIYRSNVTWDDIAGMEDVKNSLKYTLGFFKARIPQGSRLNVASRILLYGPPGTGKTLLAAACSNMLGATFFNVKASNLLSKWFGESTQLVSALYVRARAAADETGMSVVFIDEFDALGRARGDGGESGAERRILSTLLSELEGLAEKGDSSRVITIVATNKPWDIDEAILERFKRHIYVGLPDNKGREAIFRIHTEEKGLGVKGVTYSYLADQTEGYSGRLIERVCQYAEDSMMREMNPSIPQHVDEGTIQDYELVIHPLKKEDFLSALKKVQPTTSKATIDKLDDYQARIGGEMA